MTGSSKYGRADAPDKESHRKAQKRKCAMLILLSYAVPQETQDEILADNVLYRPGLEHQGSQALARALTALRPDVLLVRSHLEPRAAQAWRTAAPGAPRLVIATDPAAVGDPELAALGIVWRTVAYTDGGVELAALALAERSWTKTVSCAELPARLARAATRRARWVTLVGGGIVNLMTALRLARTAYRRRYFAPLSREESWGGQREAVRWINADGARAAVARSVPDVIVICGTTYVHPEVLAMAPLAVNVHGGHLPHYKGNHGIFFAYERSDFEHIGASLHVATAELDGGELIEVVRPEVFPHDHDEHLYCRAVHAAALRLCALLEALESGSPLVFAPQPPIGRTYRHRDRTPGRELRLWLRRRLGLHPVPHLPAAVERPPGASHLP